MMRQYARLSACQAQRDRLCSGSCISHCAAVAELVDATDSKSVSGDRVGVRFPSAAPLFTEIIESSTINRGLNIFLAEDTSAIAPGKSIFYTATFSCLLMDIYNE